MKTIALGDTHGRDLWKRIIEKEKPNRVIFIGDYFDSRDVDTATQVNNFLEICGFKIEHPEIEIILLIGNHDIHYFPEIGDTGTSGYQEGARYMIQHAIGMYRDLLQMVYKLDEEGLDPIIFTHAGISEIWIEMAYGRWEGEFADVSEVVEELWKHKPSAFLFNGRDHYGNDTYQTPIWIRPQSLMRANKTTLKNQIIQVVGHTNVKEIDIEGKATGGRYYFIDTIDVGQYLIIEDSKFKLGKMENNEFKDSH